MGFSIDTKCIVRGEEKHLNKLNGFLNSIKDEYDRVEFDKLCDYIPIYDSELETSNIKANLDQNEILEINDEKVLQFWVHGWKGDYLGYIKQLIKDKELGLYDKNEDRSVLTLYYFSYIESWDYCVTNDEDGVFFSTRFILTDFDNILSDEDETGFDCEDDVIEYLKEGIKDIDLSETNDLTEIIKILENNDIYFGILKVKTEQEIEEERRKTSW